MMSTVKSFRKFEVYSNVTQINIAFNDVLLNTVIWPRPS